MEKLTGNSLKTVCNGDSLHHTTKTAKIKKGAITYITFAAHYVNVLLSNSTFLIFVLVV